MTFYNWCGTPDGAEYTPATESDERRLCWYDELTGDPLPPLNEWTPPTLIQYLGENGKRPARPPMDTVSSGPLHFINGRAANALKDIWKKYACLYPVVLDDAKDDDYFMVVATTELDCIDRSRSTGPLQKFGSTPDLFASVYTWNFDQDCVGDAVMFVLPDDATNIFVTEGFKSLIEAANLRGFCLRSSFWDENKWVS